MTVKGVMGGWYEPPVIWRNPTYLDDNPLVVGYSSYLSHATARWEAMFDGEDICDPFSKGEADAPFEIRPSLFLKSALKHAPQKPGNTVSAFTDWVYSLYRTSAKDPLALEFGLKVERSIFQERSDLIKQVSFAEDKKQFPDWKLIHNGLGYNSAGENPVNHFFDIADLPIHGTPIRGSPDLIYKNQQDGSVVIVEIKFTRKPIPSNLWPNVWAQLWAYSKIPIVKDCPNLTIVGEVWGNNIAWKSKQELMFDVYLRRSVRRNPRQLPFEKFFNTLFSIYRGDFAIKRF